MDEALFELPESAPMPLGPSARGAKGQRWRCSVTATATVVDSVVLEQTFSTTETGYDLALADEGESSAADDLTPKVFDQIAWLLWPHAGLEEALDAGVFRLDSVETRVDTETDVQGTVTWSSEVRLNDVAALRALAVRAHPNRRTEIDRDIEVAWLCAFDPYAPIEQIPGITWTPGRVSVEHLPARPSKP